MKYASIRKLDIQNGPGCRVSLFTQGCNIRCKGCFNYDLWNYEGGKEWNKEIYNHFLELANSPHIAGISILGGEPLSSCNLNELSELFKQFKKIYPDKSIWLWTGYKYEKLSKEQMETVALIDVLVDGPWIQEKSDFKLKYRGSPNQRIIDVKKSLDTNTVVTLDI